MIKILDETLDQAIDLLQIVETCPHSHYCVWEKRPKVFEIENILPKGCPKTKCEVYIFRTKVESESPIFYAEALTLSGFNDIFNSVSDLLWKYRKKGTKKKKGRKFFNRAYDLRIFTELFILAFYPLALESQIIPFFDITDFQKIADKLTEEEVRITIKKMTEVNLEWLGWLQAIVEDLFNQRDYTAGLIFLIYLYFNVLEKNQLPDLMNMPEAEKSAFFSDLEKEIFKQE